MEKNNFFANPDKSGHIMRSIVAFGIVCMLLFAVVSCAGSKDPYATDDIPFDKPIDVPFTEISLLEACKCEHWGCGWVRVNRESQLTIINNDRELRRHVICAENVPVIDFSRYTLLLARGVAGHGLHSSRQELQQLSTRNYVMNVYWGPTLASVITHWHVAIITDKLDGNNNVKLNATIIW